MRECECERGLLEPKESAAGKMLAPLWEPVAENAVLFVLFGRRPTSSTPSTLRFLPLFPS